MTNNQTVIAVDLGFTSARQFWDEVALQAYERFLTTPNGRTAIEVAAHAWHIHEWLWHEMPDPKPNLKDYRKTIIGECIEVAWVQDIAEAGKHRRLKRSTVTVARAIQIPDFVTFNGEPAIFNKEQVTFGEALSIELNDRSVHQVATVLEKVVAYWETRLPR